MSVLYWNCRGYNSNFEDLKVLLQINNPQIVCLQETFHGYRTPNPPSQYDIIPANPIIAYDQGVRPSRGVVTLIHNSTPYHPITLITRLEAVAIRTQCCLLYTSPSPRDKRQSRMPSSA